MPYSRMKDIIAGRRAFDRALIRAVPIAVLCAIAALTVLVSFSNREDPETALRRTLDEASTCEVDDDCMAISAKCPVGCYAYVNRDDVADARGAMRTFKSPCVQKCGEAPEFACVESRCKAVDSPS